MYHSPLWYIILKMGMATSLLSRGMGMLTSTLFREMGMPTSILLLEMGMLTSALYLHLLKRDGDAHHHLDKGALLYLVRCMISHSVF